MPRLSDLPRRLAAWLGCPRPTPGTPKPADPRAERMARLWRLGEATASLSHDLGQPLNVIRLTAEATLDALDHGRADPERIRRALRTGIEQTTRMQDMIDTLLAGTRRPLDGAERVCPAQAVRRALDKVGERIGQGGIALVTEIDEGCPRVKGHAARLEMAVVQALLNACEALSAAALAPDAKDGTVRVGCRGEDGMVVIAIADDGPGFPPALLASLDAPLPETGGKRLGLGLVIILGVAAEMGGDAVITNAHPGTRIELRLPAASTRREVLVVADDARTMAQDLTGRGWRAHVAEDAAVALSLFDHARPDAVVADPQVGAGTGWSLIAELRARAPDTPIIAVTQDARRAVEAGAVLALGRPVSLGDLAHELDELVNGM